MIPIKNTPIVLIDKAADHGGLRSVLQSGYTETELGWIGIALGLGLIEIWLADGFSSRRLSPVTKRISNYLKRLTRKSERGKNMNKIWKLQFSSIANVMAVSLVLCVCL